MKTVGLRRAPSCPDGLSYGAIITLINSNDDVFPSYNAALGYGGPFKPPKRKVLYLDRAKTLERECLFLRRAMLLVT